MVRDCPGKRTQQMVWWWQVLSSCDIKAPALLCICSGFGYCFIFVCLFICFYSFLKDFALYWRTLRYDTGQIWYLSAFSFLLLFPKLKLAPFWPFRAKYNEKESICSVTGFLFQLLVKWRQNKGQFWQKKCSSNNMTLLFYCAVYFLLNTFILFSPSTYFYLSLSYNPM